MNIFEHGAFILRQINIICDSFWDFDHIKCSVQVVQVWYGKYYMSGSVLIQYSNVNSAVQFKLLLYRFTKCSKHQGLNFCLKQYSMSKNNRPCFIFLQKLLLKIPILVTISIRHFVWRNLLQDNNYTQHVSFYEWLYDNPYCLDFQLYLGNYSMLHIYSANDH
jgi:hypothetical protein